MLCGFWGGATEPAAAKPHMDAGVPVLGLREIGPDGPAAARRHPQIAPFKDGAGRGNPKVPAAGPQTFWHPRGPRRAEMRQRRPGREGRGRAADSAATAKDLQGCARGRLGRASGSAPDAPRQPNAAEPRGAGAAKRRPWMALSAGGSRQESRHTASRPFQRAPSRSCASAPQARVERLDAGTTTRPFQTRGTGRGAARPDGAPPSRSRRAARSRRTVRRPELP